MLFKYFTWFENDFHFKRKLNSDQLYWLMSCIYLFLFILLLKNWIQSFASAQTIKHKKHHVICCWKSKLGLVQAQKCGRVKPSIYIQFYIILNFFCYLPNMKLYWDNWAFLIFLFKVVLWSTSVSQRNPASWICFLTWKIKLLSIWEDLLKKMYLLANKTNTVRTT